MSLREAYEEVPMKTHNYLYKQNQSIEEVIPEDSRSDKEVLILIHTAIHKKEEAVELAKQVKKRYPNGVILGTSAMAVICNSQCSENCLISITELEHAKVALTHIDYRNKAPLELINEVKASSVREDTKAMLVFASDYYSDICQFTDIFYETEGLEHITLVGGLASSNIQLEEPPFIFTEEGGYPYSLIAVTLSGETLTTYANVTVGHEPLGGTHVMTKVEGNELKEVDHTEALTWFRNTLGQVELIENIEVKRDTKQDVLAHFPLLIEGKDKVSRLVKYNKEDNKICFYFINEEESQSFRLGYLSPYTTAKQCQAICKELSETPVETIFAYSCTHKMYYMKNCAQWELTPFHNADLCGAFLSGEIGMVNGRQQFLNGACSLLSMAEQVHFISIDEESFGKMQMLDEDFEELYHYVIKNETESMFQQNSKLLETIKQQKELAQKELFYDAGTAIPNLTKYMFDCQKRDFDKICMISIEKGHILLSRFGDKIFQDIFATNIRQVQKYIKHENLSIYVYDLHSFFVVGDTSFDKYKFQDICKKLYKKFGFLTIDQYNITLMNDFAIAISKEKVLEKVRLTMANIHNSGSRFLIYDSSLNEEKVVENEIQMISILNDAISHNRIVPYFQPIYDNKTRKCEKFEALMRIVGANAEIYYPNQFLEIAKEYRLYLQLSKIMLSKVFNYFSNRSEMVSINISAYDICSDEMVELIFNELKKSKCPQNFIFEIVESEELRDFDRLMDFTREIKRLGGQIAIDDFGAGYSNLLEIINLNPKYIKIDGEIVRKILTNTSNQAIIETIVFLAEKIGVELVAEFVESEELQKKIRENNIRYSQGYYFSKPVSLEDVEKIMKEKSLDGK